MVWLIQHIIHAPMTRSARRIRAVPADIRRRQRTLQGDRSNLRHFRQWAIERDDEELLERISKRLAELDAIEDQLLLDEFELFGQDGEHE